MKFAVFIFASIALLIQASTNTYIAKRLLWLCESFSLSKLRLPIIVVIVFLASAFILSKILAQVFSFPSSNFFYEFLEVSGSFWLGFMAYFVLGFLLLDIIFWPLAFIKIHPYLLDIKKYVYLTFVFFVVLVLVWGYYNAHHVQVVHYGIKAPAAQTSQTKTKSLQTHRSISVGVASDLHLGAMIDKKQARKITQALLSFKPDVILLAGDIFDAALSSVLYHNSGEELKALQAAPWGVYAAAGNHEYIGSNIDTKLTYLNKLGIKVLRDECQVIQNSFVLVGRDDASASRFSNPVAKRKSLSQILASCENNETKDLPVIVLDHQPVALQESKDQKVLLHLSGHTHHGQLWPFSWITRKMFALSYGLKKLEDTWVYVSSGAGFWGPPFRTSGKAEVIEFVIDFP